MKVGYARFVVHVDRYFQEIIEVLLAMVMLLYAILTLIPYELLPSSTGVYGLSIIKIPFGLLLLAPSTTILWLRYKHGMANYTLAYRKKRHKILFYMTVGWLYLVFLRLTITVYPPFFVLYLILAIFSYLCYIRVNR